MILPIVSYGSSVLRKKCDNVSLKDFSLDILLKDMWETMYAASGVGLAAPQINQSVRLFIIDTSPFSKDLFPNEPSLKQVFINPEIVSEEGPEWVFNEGCLSIPDVREDVKRKSIITISYQDEDLNLHIKTFDGIAARVIQHEYDHINGVLFIDKISVLRKRIIKSKLSKISKGNVDVDYRMKF